MDAGHAREILEVERAQTLQRLDALVDEFNDPRDDEAEYLTANFGNKWNHF